MFIAALFTLAKTWKQPKCPLTDKEIKKIWQIMYMLYRYVTLYGILFSCKKDEMMPFIATSMDLRDDHTK